MTPQQIILKISNEYKVIPEKITEPRRVGRGLGTPNYRMEAIYLCYIKTFEDRKTLGKIFNISCDRIRVIAKQWAARNELGKPSRPWYRASPGSI